MIAPTTARISQPDDQRIFMTVPWSHYEIMLAVRSDAPTPRMSYLEGTLELTSPSKQHERIKSMLGQLLETYAADRDIDLWPLGSWTLKDPRVERGVEPDECYTIGDPDGRSRPDLAIEVVWTHGGIDKLAIYASLGVPEVWRWRDERIAIYRLEGGEDRVVDQSEILPGADVDVIARAALLSPREARAALQATYD